MLRQYLRLNRNILAAFAASIAVSAVIAQALSDQADHLNTTLTTITDYAVYFSVFGGLFYLDNRSKYRAADGKTDSARLAHDLKKLVTSLGIAEIVYTVVRWTLQYYLLTIGYDPYLASIISQGISTVVYMAVVNMGVKLTRLYRDG